LGVIRSSLSGGFGSHYTTWHSSPNSSKGKLQLSLVCVELCGLERAGLERGFESSSRKLSLSQLCRQATLSPVPRLRLTTVSIRRWTSFSIEAEGKKPSASSLGK